MGKLHRVIILAPANFSSRPKARWGKETKGKKSIYETAASLFLSGRLFLFCVPSFSYIILSRNIASQLAPGVGRSSSDFLGSGRGGWGGGGPHNSLSSPSFPHFVRRGNAQEGGGRKNPTPSPSAASRRPVRRSERKGGGNS